jgi:hypothetical protein
MTEKHEQLILALLCLVIVLLSVVGLAWSFQAALLAPQITMDGLLLVLICLTMLTVFGTMLYSIAKSVGWLQSLRSWRRKETKGELAEPILASREVQNASSTANPDSQAEN